MKPRIPRGKTMRVATALTGVTACAAGFLPTAAAQAARSTGRPGKPAEITTDKEKVVRLKILPSGRSMGPDNTAPRQPYVLDIFFKASVYNFQVCGWHPNNEHRCTPWTSDHEYTTPYTAYSVGGNGASWDRGQITIAWNSGGPGCNDTCNTNAAYYGSPYSSAGRENVLLYAPGGGPIGDGVPEC